MNVTPLPHVSPRQLALDVLAHLPESATRYDTADRSFSPFFSNIGLGLGATSGIETVFTHYNRRTQYLGNPAIRFDGGSCTGNDAFSLRFERAQVAFFARDAFLIEVEGDVSFDFLGDRALTSIRQWDTESGVRHVRLLLENRDMRDPDRAVPMLVSMRQVSDHVHALAFQFLTIDPAASEQALMDAPESADAARARTVRFFEDVLSGMTVAPRDPKEAGVLASAIFTLLSNTTAAPGQMAGYWASFPSRGGYPTHFLWDACFHVLGLMDMNPKLARDAVMVLAGNQRADGMIAHFLCSTWMRPEASQPPLLGWAAEKLAECLDQPEARQLKADLLDVLIANNRWWLDNRPTRFGLISCIDPFETGWDDTPRLDDGPIIPCDMNAYLLMQMRTAARFAADIGDPRTEDLEDEAEAFAQALVEVLYDGDRNLFFDADLETGNHRNLLTPAAFLPLLAGVPLVDYAQQDMLRDHLLDPLRFTGTIPFPSVAYDEICHDPGQMWRGPTWPPVYWLVLETLGKHGFAAERWSFAERLHQIILDDGNLHEYFHARTGEGLGFAQQGWTAAIFLRLHRDMMERQA